MSVPKPPSEPVGTDPFFRYSELAPVHVENLPENETDLFRPARIVDLLVLDFRHREREIEVQFTVSGDDLMDGTGQYAATFSS